MNNFFGKLGGNGLPTTTNRVLENTPAEYNQQIWEQTRWNVAFYSFAGREAIERRLNELDREWDIERLLEVNAASFVFLGTMFGLLKGRSWLVIPAVVSAFLLQHALQGWCPPVSVFRRLGVRTSREIELERNALKALRGDYDHEEFKDGVGQQQSERVQKALEAAQG